MSLVATQIGDEGAVAKQKNATALFCSVVSRANLREMQQTRAFSWFSGATINAARPALCFSGSAIQFFVP